MRGQVLLARRSQQIAAHMMPLIGAERPLSSLREQKFFGREAVINGQKFSALEHVGRRAAPLFRCWADLEDKLIGQVERHGVVEWWSGGVLRSLLGTYWRRWAHLYPGEPAVAERDTPLEPGALFGIPAQTMDRKRIQQLVRENNSRDAAFLTLAQLFQVGDPT